MCITQSPLLSRRELNKIGSHRCEEKKDNKRRKIHFTVDDEAKKVSHLIKSHQLKDITA